MRILAGDVGGTKTLLALFEAAGEELRPVRERSFSSRDYEALEEIAVEFLDEERGAPPEVACFGVAGPVRGGSVRTTNLPWRIESSRLVDATGASRVVLLNDLQAAALGMLSLPADELVILQPGAADAAGNAAVIAPGTGLGEALLYWDGSEHRPVASEGGHADFAPRTEQEDALLRYLRSRLGGHVSYERVLSGDGIGCIYEFLRESSRSAEPDWLRDQLATGDPNAAITRAALAGEDPVCVATLELFCSILGAEAGNLALRCTATAGVYVGGGIAPQILPALEKGGFLRAFTDKGRFSEWTRAIPVRVSLDPRAPLLGAARFAVPLDRSGDAPSS